jgi:hypothetical protein
VTEEDRPLTHPPPGTQPDPFQPPQPYSQPPPSADQPQPPADAPHGQPPQAGQPHAQPQPPANAPYGQPPPHADQPYGQPLPHGQPYGQGAYGHNLHGQNAYGQNAYGAGPYGQPYGPRTNTLAILALVLAFFFPPAGIVMGHLARTQIRQTGEAGDGLAVAGLWVGYVFSALYVLGCAAWLITLAFSLIATSAIP